jgi:hypothetical protein
VEAHKNLPSTGLVLCTFRLFAGFSGSDKALILHLPAAIWVLLQFKNGGV